MSNKMKISMIGAGALGGAVARGLSKAGCQVGASTLPQDMSDAVRNDGVDLYWDNVRAATEGDIVMFALKPHLTLGAVKELAGLLKGKLCASLAASISLERLISAAPEARWVRGITNIAAAMGCAFTGVALAPDATEQDKNLCQEVFSLFGDVEFVDEKLFDAITSVSGAAPAFFLTLMEAAALGGVQAGLPATLSYKVAGSAMRAAACLALESGSNPAALRDAVCTPGGMTIEGIHELEERGVRGTMMKAILRSAEKGRSIGESLLKKL